MQPEQHSEIRLDQNPAIDLEVGVEEALETVAGIAELWGGEWSRHGTGGSLELPVAAGVRRGVIRGRIEVQKLGGGSRVTYEAEAEQYRLQSREVGVLVLGGLGGLFLVIAPFVPELFDLIPMAGLLLLLAWFLVVSRLRNRNISDFLAEVQKATEHEEHD